MSSYKKKEISKKVYGPYHLIEMGRGDWEPLSIHVWLVVARGEKKFWFIQKFVKIKEKRRRHGGR